MSVLIAILVALLTVGSGIVGGLWKLAGLLQHQADRIGVGSLRGGMLLNRVRFPLLLWAVALLAAAVVLSVVWRSHTGVIVALIGGLVIAAPLVLVLPKRAPKLLMRLARVTGKRLRARVGR